MTIISDETVKARKRHICNLCGQPIHPGEEYRKCVNKDGDIFTWREHMRCGKMVERFSKLGYMDYHEYGAEDFDEAVKIYAEDVFGISKDSKDMFDYRGLVERVWKDMEKSDKRMDDEAE